VSHKNSTVKMTSVDFGAESTSFGGGEEIKVRIEEEA
jgi:hypothetical protein